MQRIVSILFFTLALAPGMLRAQGANLLQHIWWQAAGDRFDELWGDDLDTIGFADSTAQHAVSIGENYDVLYQDVYGPVISSYVLNRTPKDSLHPDTARVYEFPGQKIIRGNISGSGRGDFIVYNQPQRRITVLYADSIPFHFDTVLVLQGNTNNHEFGASSIAISNFDSSQTDGFVIADAGYYDSLGENNSLRVGRILYWRGGQKLDTIPEQVAYGDSNETVDGDLAVGHVFDQTHQYLAVQIYSGFWIVLYPLGPNFNLNIPPDTIKIVDNSSDRPTGRGHFLLADVFGTGVDAMIMGASPRTHVYGGLGGAIPITPTYYFTSSDYSSAGAFGTNVCDVGDVTGKKSHSLAISDVDVGAGKVYLFNLQKALKDSVTASAEGNHGGFGTSIITPGDVANIGRNAIMIGGDAELDGEGRVVCLLGDTGWAPPAAVNEPQLPPIGLTLMQNYPNPFIGKTDISFLIDDAKLNNSEVILNIYDMLGRELYTAYRGKAENGEITIRLNVAGLPAGNYFYRLSGGGKEVTKMMSVMK